jgi:hypothetical protein
MHKKNYFDQYRIARSKELDDLSLVLLNHGVCNDTGPIYSAANECRTAKPKGNRSFWGYSITNLIFRRLRPACCFLPKKVSDLTLTLDIRVVGICDEGKDVIDPMQELVIDIKITGKAEDQRNVCCIWHLDRHEDELGSQSPDEAHPRYHFQYGGRLLESETVNFNHGDSLLLKSPRVAHPPLDGILGIDFIISNFFGSEWRKLKLDGTYNNLIKNAQNRFWKPYVITTFQPWIANGISGKSKWLANHVWPQLA